MHTKTIDTYTKHTAHMHMAIELAEHGRYTVGSNPCVGALFVKDDAIIARGAHYVPGSAHAEIAAIEDAGAQSLRDTVCYITLEPCAVHGKTPPCIERILAVRPQAVVIATYDPNPATYGKSVRALKDAGIPCLVGVCAPKARACNAGFFSRFERKRPFVRLKSAVTLNGMIGTSDKRIHITGKETFLHTQRLRARSQAVLTGIDTVLVDDCLLDVRDHTAFDRYELHAPPHQPYAVVLDTHLRIPKTARLLQKPDRIIVFCGHDAPHTKEAALTARGVRIHRIQKNVHGLCIETALHILATEYAVGDLLIEAGATLTRTCVASGIIDTWHMYIAPHLLQSATVPVMKNDGDHRFRVYTTRTRDDAVEIVLRPIP